jgi:membrane-bound lytic murein transglycosylase D
MLKVFTSGLVKKTALSSSVIFLTSCAHLSPIQNQKNHNYKTPKNSPTKTINDFKVESQKSDLDNVITNNTTVTKLKFLRKVNTSEYRTWVKYFSKRGKDRFERYLKNGEKYRPLIERTFEDYGLPKELFYVGLIESGYYLKSRSKASAVGPWQFIKDTGKRYGLAIRSNVDERHSIIKSTQAAALFFQDLYNIFGSWELALSAYNAGEYGVIRRIRKANTRDFYELSKRKSLPRETRNYVPKVLAAMEVYNNAKKYNISIPVYKVDPFKNIKEVELRKSVYISKLAKSLGVSSKAIKDLNPDLKRNATPYIRKGYTVILPGNKNYSLIKSLKPINQKRVKSRKTASIKNSKSSRYKVRKGDNLYSIARKNHTSISKIMKLNSMKKKRIYIGQKLKLPYVDLTTHIVKNGDFLIKIAKKYKITVSKLKQINSMKSSKIFIGQRLIISVN